MIKKDVFLKQMSELLAEYSKYLSEYFSHKTFLMSVLQYVLDNIDEYFNNKTDFKQKYDSVRHIRVFDIAYKKTITTGILKCVLKIPQKQIREALSIVQAGEYVRFDLNYCSKMHIWQCLYLNSKSTNAKYLTVACYENYDENKTK